MINQLTYHGVRATLSRNQDDALSIAFFDPTYVRADSVFYNSADHSIHAVIEGWSYYVGDADEVISSDLKSVKDIELMAVRPDGSILKMRAPVISGSA